jgi:hypothetical protein
MAAQAVIEARHEADRALPLYRQSIRPIHAAIRQARLLRPIVFHPSMQKTFVARFRTSRTMRAEYLALLGGEREYGEITRAMLGRLPRYFLRTFDTKGTSTP